MLIRSLTTACSRRTILLPSKLISKRTFSTPAPDMTKFGTLGPPVAPQPEINPYLVAAAFSFYLVTFSGLLAYVMEDDKLVAGHVRLYSHDIIVRGIYICGGLFGVVETIPPPLPSNPAQPEPSALSRKANKFFLPTFDLPLLKPLENSSPILGRESSNGVKSNKESAPKGTAKITAANTTHTIENKPRGKGYTGYDGEGLFAVAAGVCLLLSGKK